MLVRTRQSVKWTIGQLHAETMCDLAQHALHDRDSVIRDLNDATLYINLHVIAGIFANNWQFQAQTHQGARTRRICLAVTPALSQNTGPRIAALLYVRDPGNQAVVKKLNPICHVAELCSPRVCVCVCVYL